MFVKACHAQQMGILAIFFYLLTARWWFRQKTQKEACKW